MNFLQNFGWSLLIIVGILIVAKFIEFSIDAVGGKYHRGIQNSVLIFWIALILSGCITGLQALKDVL